MISQIYWLVPDQVLYWKLSGNIPAVEIWEMAQFIISQFKNHVSQKVHLIIDTTGINKLDYTNRKAHKEFALLAKQAWMGYIIAIVPSIKIQVQLSAMSNIFGMRWKNVPSMSMAIRFLKTNDNLIQDIPQLKLDSILKRPMTTVN